MDFFVTNGKFLLERTNEQREKVGLFISSPRFICHCGWYVSTPFNKAVSLTKRKSYIS